MPISITATSNSPYEDSFTEDGLLQYKYRGTDPNHRDNIGLKQVMKTRTPLVYFHSIKPGKYVAVWPVFILQDYPEKLTFLVAIDPA